MGYDKPYECGYGFSLTYQQMSCQQITGQSKGYLVSLVASNKIVE
jgi:hypothetical protein